MSVEEKAASIISKVGLWWPLAEEDQLRQAAVAYEQVAKAALAAAATGTAGARLVTGGNTGEAVAAFDKHWALFAGDSSAGLPATAQAASSVAAALKEFAQKVEEAKRKIINLAIEIGATIAVGAGLALFTFGTSAGAAATRVAMLVARGVTIAMGLTGVAQTIVATLLVVIAGGALEGFLSSIVAQGGQILLSDGQGISISKAMNWAGWGAATAPVGYGLGLAARSAFRAVRTSDNILLSRIGSGGRVGAAGDGLPTPGGPGWKGDVPHVNPSGSTTNCVNCTVATDDLLAGKPFVPAPASAPRPLWDLEKHFGGKFVPVSGSDEIFTMLENAGPGARLIVFRGKGRGVVDEHVFNGYVDSLGVVRFVDGQSGKPIRWWAAQAKYKIMWTNKP